MNILLVCATRTEGKPLRKLLSQNFLSRQDLGIDCWESGRSRIRIVHTGISMEKVARAFQEVRRPLGASGNAVAQPRKFRSERPARPASESVSNTAQAVIVFGIAGQIDPAAPVGTIVIPRIWRSELHEKSLPCSGALLEAALQSGRAFQSTGKIICGGSGITLQQPAMSKGERNRVGRRYPDTAICDMETFAVMERFPEADRLAIRIVSDDGSEIPGAAFCCAESQSIGKLGITPSKNQPPALLPGVREYCATLAQFVYAFLRVLSRD